MTMNAGEPDPDPAFLYVSQELKRKIDAKFYDPKRSCYVPHPEEKFAEGMVQEVPNLYHENCWSLPYQEEE